MSQEMEKTFIIAAKGLQEAFQITGSDIQKPFIKSQSLLKLRKKNPYCSAYCRQKAAKSH
jgi:hypothetical protein